MFCATITGVDCDVAREALSARIDGEREPVPGQRVDEHLEGCAECRDWYYRAREATRQLRTLAGQSRPPMSAVPEAAATYQRPPPGLTIIRWRWALGVVGFVQVALAVFQAAGLALGVPIGIHSTHTPMSGHLLNESTAWSVALGAAMIVAAAWPAAAAGVSAVLVVFTVALVGYVFADMLSGAVTPLRILSHVPVLLGAVLAVLVWRSTGSPQPGPANRAAAELDQIVLPDNASRGRRRGHLRPTDDSAA